MSAKIKAYFFYLLLFTALLFNFCESKDKSDEFLEDIMSNSDTSSDTNDDDNSNNSQVDITSILSKFDNIEAITYEVSEDYIIFTTTNLPNHKSPYWNSSHDLYEGYNGTNSNWHQNPNQIGEQNITFRIPLYPKEAANKEATSLGPIGLSVNGVVFFNQYAGPNEQALTNEINSFDQYLGHPTGTSMYHYHIEPTYLTGTLGKSAFLGLLADGFPVYGPEEDGKTLTSADLDEYHGHFGPTAEFPDGIYHYHVTVDPPYINGNGYFGEVGSITR